MFQSASVQNLLGKKHFNFGKKAIFVDFFLKPPSSDRAFACFVNVFYNLPRGCRKYEFWVCGVDASWGEVASESYHDRV